MAVTPTYNGAVPTVGGDSDVWGGKINVAFGQIKVDLDALAAQGNANETGVAGALPKAGGTMTGDVALADVAPTSILSAGFRGLPAVTIGVDRTLVGADAGKAIRFFGAANRILTIPTNATVPFPIGTVVPVRSYVSSPNAVTITPAPGVTLTIAGSLVAVSSATIASGGFASLWQEDPNIWMISGTGVS